MDIANQAVRQAPVFVSAPVSASDVKVTDSSHEEKPTSRRNEIRNRKINLTHTTPVARLGQLCSQGKYKYIFFFDRFENGVLMTCEFFKYINNRRVIVLTESVYCPLQKDDRLDDARNRVAYQLLARLGLAQGLAQAESQQAQNDGETMVISMVQALAEQMRNSCSQPRDDDDQQEQDELDEDTEDAASLD